MLRRSFTIAWGIPLVGLCIWLGGPLLALGTAVLAIFALREFWGLGRAFGVTGGLRWEVLAGAVLLIAGAGIGRAWFNGAFAIACTGVLVAGVVRAAATGGGPALRGQLAATVWAILALVYIPWLLGHVLLLRGGAGGLHDTLFTVGIVWVGDVAAYVLGGLLGRHRLAASVSPGKSVEGALGAVLLGAAAAALAAGVVHLAAPLAACIGAVLAAAGMAGDLWESVLKRAADVKDSGGGVPGHGGLLDRFDSLLLAAPIGYWLLQRIPWDALGRLR